MCIKCTKCITLEQCVSNLYLHKYILTLFDLIIIVFNIICINKYRFREPKFCTNNPSLAIYCTCAMVYAFSLKINACCYVFSFIPLILLILWGTYILVDTETECKISYHIEMPKLELLYYFIYIYSIVVCIFSCINYYLHYCYDMTKTNTLLDLTEIKSNTNTNTNTKEDYKRMEIIV